METVEAGGTTLRYTVDGGADRPTVAFVPEAGFGPWLWGWQAPALAGPYRTVVYAPRGTDGTPAAGPYTVDRFAADLEAVLSAVGAAGAHLVGAGLGAAVALRHARRYGRARSLSLLGGTPAGARVDDDALRRLVPADDGALRASLPVAFSERFLAESGVVEDVLAWRREEDAAGEAREGHLAALRGFEAGPLYEVTLPALVCHGLADPVVPPSAGEELAADLPRGRFEAVEGRRLHFVEHAAAVTDAVDAFVDSVGAGG